MSIGNEKTMKAAAGVGEKSGLVSLSLRQRCDEASEFELELFRRIVAQDEAALALSQIYQVYLAKLMLAGKPLGALLFLGPTGSGKTRAVEAAAEALFGDPRAMVKIDCAEFQHSHEISKLTGSPPGYLSHLSTGNDRDGAFLINCADGAKDFLLTEGFDRSYGARPLKRVTERHLIIPLSRLIATMQVAGGEVVGVGVNDEARELCFKKAPDLAMAPLNTSGVYGSWRSKAV
jgi:ATP-dependent Clp protease ATP-binding subunit ClpA